MPSIISMLDAEFEDFLIDKEIKDLKMERKKLTDKEYMKRLDHVLTHILQEARIISKESKIISQ